MLRDPLKASSWSLYNLEATGSMVPSRYGRFSLQNHGTVPLPCAIFGERPFILAIVPAGQNGGAGTFQVPGINYLQRPLISIVNTLSLFHPDMIFMVEFEEGLKLLLKVFRAFSDSCSSNMLWSQVSD